MFRNKHSKPQNRIDTLIGADTVIEGNISFAGGMRIDGKVNGNVMGMPGAASTLVLSEQGSVNGEIVVSHLVVNGEINGNVTASEYLELHAKARVSGDVQYQILEIQIGAVLEGRLVNCKSAGHENVVELKTNTAK